MVNMPLKIKIPESRKEKCVDALLIFMVLISVSGLVYSLWHS